MGHQVPSGNHDEPGAPNWTHRSSCRFTGVRGWEEPLSCVCVCVCVRVSLSLSLKLVWSSLLTAAAAQRSVAPAPCGSDCALSRLASATSPSLPRLFPSSFRPTFKMTGKKRVRRVKLVGVWDPLRGVRSVLCALQGWRGVRRRNPGRHLETGTGVTVTVRVLLKLGGFCSDCCCQVLKTVTG